MHPGLCSPSTSLQPKSRASRPRELQSPAAGPPAGSRGARVTWALSLGGLFLSAAVAAGGPGPFVWSSCRGWAPGAARPAAFPQLARSWPPHSGVGGPPPGPASPQAPPSRPLPARPPAPPGQLKGKNWLGLLAGPSHLHLRSRCHRHHHHHHPPGTEPQAAPRPSGRRHEDQGCQETL